MCMTLYIGMYMYVPESWFGMHCHMAMRLSLSVSESEYVDLFNVYYTLIIISYRGQTWME